MKIRWSIIFYPTKLVILGYPPLLMKTWASHTDDSGQGAFCRHPAGGPWQYINFIANSNKSKQKMYCTSYIYIYTHDNSQFPKYYNPLTSKNDFCCHGTFRNCSTSLPSLGRRWTRHETSWNNGNIQVLGKQTQTQTWMGSQGNPLTVNHNPVRYVY